jgi:hypothetical protein
MKGTRVFVAVAMVAVAAFLGGCAQVGAAGVGTPTASSRPTAISTPVSAHIGPVACDALATPDAVAALVGGTGAVHAIEKLQAGSPPSAPPWSVENANGTVCGWGGLSGLIAEQGTPQVFLEVVPGLAAQWNALAQAINPGVGATYDGAISRGGSCHLGSGSGSCATEILVGGAWMHVEAISDGRSSFTEQTFHEFVQGVVTRYASLAAPTPVVPHAVRDCGEARLQAAVSEGMGSAQPDSRGEKDFTLFRAQLDAGQTTTCSFVSADNPEHGWAGWVTVLDGVDPALFAQYRQAVDRPHGEPVDVSSLPGTAVGVSEATEDSTRITVDVLTGTTWVELYTYASTDPKAVVASVSHIIGSGWLG